jgi:hypothetical protein
MAEVDPGSVSLIESLPSAHRKFLLKKYAKRLPKDGNRRAKSQALAQVIGPNRIHNYVNLYLSGNPRLFVWYLDDADNLNLAIGGIEARLVREHSKARSGIEPELEPGGPPRFHRFFRHGQTLVLEFGVSDSHREVMRNWRSKEYASDSVYRVAIREDPFTVELRVFGSEKQAKLLQATRELLKADLSSMVRCDLSTKTRYTKLQKGLAGRFCKVVHTATGMGISRSSLDADLVAELDATVDYKAQSSTSYRQEWSRSYEFATKHPDGYSELAQYTMNLESGDLRLSPGISELAVENLRQNVTKLF